MKMHNIFAMLIFTTMTLLFRTIVEIRRELYKHIIYCHYLLFGWSAASVRAFNVWFLIEKESVLFTLMHFYIQLLMGLHVAGSRGMLSPI